MLVFLTLLFNTSWLLSIFFLGGTSAVSPGWIYRRAADYGKRFDVRKGDRTNADHLHQVEFLVQLNQLSALEELFTKVSNPNDAMYGNYQSRAELAQLTANPHATKQITQFLKHHGVYITKTSTYGEHIYAEAPIAVWETLFATEFYDFQHSDWADKHLPRALAYSLPEELHPHVHSVRRVADFPFVSTRIKPVVRAYHTPQHQQQQQHAKLRSLTSYTLAEDGSNNGTIIAGHVTPAFLVSHYNITDVIGPRGNTKQGIFSSLDQYISPADLAQFQSFMHLPNQPIAGDVGAKQNRLRDSPCKSSSNCAEGNLDAQYLTGIAPLVPTYNLYYEENDFVSMLENVTSSVSPPSVISISYGSFGVDSDYASRFNTYAQIAGTMGITIVVASGDDGVHDPRTRFFPLFCDYSPSFPAFSPYVLTVGATQNAEKNRPEIGCSSDTGGVITSGGGFSPYDPLPAWQAIQVNTYFSIVNGTSKEPAPGYATNARGYPDISLLGTSFVTFIGGKRHVVYGTSASAPAIAGMISLLNVAIQQATGRNNATVGFINPLLYQQAMDYVADIVSGSNFCTAESLTTVCCNQGFYATDGWDPMTGLGVPDFGKLLSVVINAFKK